MFLRLLILFVALCVTGCMRPIPGDPVLQGEFEQRPENVMFEFYTDKGRQVAYYLPPVVDSGVVPEKLVVMYPGINSIALGWLKFIKLHEDTGAGYLLIEYPNRGFSEGAMRPEENYENSIGALKALAKHYGVEKVTASLRLLGHSFGTGMALHFAAMEHVDDIVLVAPFSDLKEGVKQKSWFLAMIMPSQIDNRELIREILAQKDSPQITVLHGRQDATLPFSMGKELVQLAPSKVRFYPFDHDDHTSVLTKRRDLIFKLLLTDD